MSVIYFALMLFSSYDSGIITAITILLHNYPEGLATFATAYHDVGLGIAITLAVAIHNVPKGVSVSMPIMYATGDKKKAFWYSFLSGFSEPIAAILAALILRPYLNETFIGGLVVFVAGIMVYISVDEIMPTAHEYCTDESCEKDGHSAGTDIVFGMFIMAVSLLLLQ